MLFTIVIFFSASFFYKFSVSSVSNFFDLLKHVKKYESKFNFNPFFPKNVGGIHILPSNIKQNLNKLL